MNDLTTFKAILNAGYPIWMLTAGGLLCLFVDTLFPKRGSKLVFSVGVFSLAVSLYFAFQQWLQTTGNGQQDLLVCDRVTLFFAFIVIFVGLMSLFSAYAYLKAHELVSGEMVSLIIFSVVGMLFLFASDHLLVNFIGLEIMSLSVYVMVGSNRHDLRSNEAAIKYYVMGSVASAVLLYGIALLYARFGTIKLGDLALLNSSVPAGDFLPTLAVVLLLTGFLFKLALVPFHFWVPDVYEGSPAPVTGLMSTGVKAASFALFIRILTALNYLPAGAVPTLLLISVIATLLVGNLGAIVQDNLKRMLAYSSISHAGYLLLGLLIGFKDGKFDPEVSSAVLFYLMGYTFTTLGAFAILSVMIEEKQEANQLTDLHGLGYLRPGLAAGLSLFLLSLLGLPLTAGFAGKYGIFAYAIKKGFITLAVFGIVTSLISAYYYLRPLVFMYFKGVPDRPRSFVKAPIHFTAMFAIVFCALATLYLGINPDNYIHLAQLAAQAFK